jgi:hypothetical protein
VTTWEALARPMRPGGRRPCARVLRRARRCVRSGCCRAGPR